MCSVRDDRLPAGPHALYFGAAASAGSFRACARLEFLAHVFLGSRSAGFVLIFLPTFEVKPKNQPLHSRPGAEFLQGLLQGSAVMTSTAKTLHPPKGFSIALRKFASVRAVKRVARCHATSSANPADKTAHFALRYDLARVNCDAFWPFIILLRQFYATHPATEALHSLLEMTPGIYLVTNCPRVSV
jgi:hypothetical protein